MTRRPSKLGDMDVSEFRTEARRVADRVADYIERLESFDVLPRIEPGAVRAELPVEPPGSP